MSDIVLIAVVVPLAKLALLFGSRELLALMFLALVTIIMFVRQSPLKGIVALMIGFLIGTIGADPMAVVRRFTFGFRPLASGIDLVPFVLGIFAVSEIFVQVALLLKSKAQKYADSHTKFKLSKENLTFQELITCWKEILIGFVIGTFLGALPGPGSTLAAYTSHATAARISKKGATFGKGALEGLSAAEAGNSATSGATFIPLFAFGIPGSAMAGLFLGAFMLQGITPGPTMFVEHAPVMYTIFGVLIIANFFNLLVGRLLSEPYAYLASAPRSILVPFLLILASLGVYAYHTSTFDVLLVVVIGIIGYIMRIHDYPLAPALIGFILAPMIEKHFRRMMTVNTNPLFFFESPIAVGLFVATIIVAIIFAYTGGIKTIKKDDIEKNTTDTDNK
jgi:putative tricarboxylic transport membrane protein